MVKSIHEIRGDFDGDRGVDVADVDELCGQLQSAQPDSSFDLTGNGLVNDRDFIILNILSATDGDSSLDGVFNSSDLIQVFQEGEYNDAVAGNSGWGDGDWNCDGDFDSSDLLLAFHAGGYSAAATLKEAAQKSSAAATMMGSPAAALSADRYDAISDQDDGDQDDGDQDDGDRQDGDAGLPAKVTARSSAQAIPSNQTRDTLLEREVDDWAADDRHVTAVAAAWLDELADPDLL